MTSYHHWLHENLPLPLLRAGVILMRRLKPTAQQKTWFRFSNKLKRPLAVLQGPFSGMTYIGEAGGSALLPKLLGTYEKGVWPVIEVWLHNPPDLLVDVGSAEGYYAVGMARRVPGLRVVCFESDRYSRYLLNRLATINQVRNRIKTCSPYTPESLHLKLDSAKLPQSSAIARAAKTRFSIPTSVLHYSEHRS